MYLSLPHKRDNKYSQETTEGVWVKVRGVSRRLFSGLVYNPEVEASNTFNAGGVAIHNCKLYYYKNMKILPVART